MVLTAYGGVLTLVGLLVQADVIHTSQDANTAPWAGTRTSGTRGS